MATADIDSFVLKLKYLMSHGYHKSLNVEFKEGKLNVNLKAEIALEKNTPCHTLTDQP